MQYRTKASKLLKDFIVTVNTQFNRGIKVVRSDNGSEFTSGPMQNFYHERGILPENSCVDTPEQNGRIERKHRHILNVARALQFQVNLPIGFLGECVLTAAYLINQTPTKLLSGRSPYEILFHTSPSFREIRVFGCLCFAWITPRDMDKFASRSKKCVFLGYPFGQKGWKVCDLETQEMFVSRNIVFCETTYPFEIELNTLGPNIVSENVPRQLHLLDDEPMFYPEAEVHPSDTRDEERPQATTLVIQLTVIRWPTVQHIGAKQHIMKREAQKRGAARWAQQPGGVRRVQRQKNMCWA